MRLGWPGGIDWSLGVEGILSLHVQQSHKGGGQCLLMKVQSVYRTDSEHIHLNALLNNGKNTFLKTHFFFIVNTSMKVQQWDKGGIVVIFKTTVDTCGILR